MNAREYQKEILDYFNSRTEYTTIILCLFGDLVKANKMSERREYLGNILIAILGYAELASTYLSFEEAEDSIRGTKIYNEAQGLCLCLQNLSSIFYFQACSEGELRLPLQRLFNNVCAMARMYCWRDPINQVFVRRWQEIKLATVAKHSNERT